MERGLIWLYLTGLHADEAAPCIECHAVDESGGEEGDEEIDRGVGSSDILVEVLHGL